MVNLSPDYPYDKEMILDIQSFFQDFFEVTDVFVNADLIRSINIFKTEENKEE